MIKYAVPMSGGLVATHFGHCEQFAIFDVDETEKQIIKREFASSPEHEPGLLPRWLTEKGVSRIIAGGMGFQAQGLFQRCHIGVIIGTMENDPEKAVTSYLNGRLVTGNNICDH